jgi:hypothetical protein
MEEYERVRRQLKADEIETLELARVGADFKQIANALGYASAKPSRHGRKLVVHALGTLKNIFQITDS